VQYGEQGYEALGDPACVSMERKAEKLLETLTENGQTVTQLVESTGLSQQDVGRCLIHLGGKVIREGAGHKGDPYQYRRNSIVPTPNGLGRTSGESI
jgi:hypothetical protein